MEPYDVLIIGGGIAGLYCARQLLRAHPSTRLVLCEHYKVLGGRMATYHKTLPGGLDVQWEIGAGRISDSHLRLHALLREYGLHTSPIGPELMYKESGKAPLERNIFEPSLDILFGPLVGLPSDILEKHTLQELLISIHGKKATQNWMDRFPYHSELVYLRADEGLREFTNEMKSHEGFSVCVEGLGALPQKIAAECVERGAVILTQYTCTGLGKGWAEFTSEGLSRKIHAKKIICALHAKAMRSIPFFKGFSTLKKIQMEPLTRMYAVFPLRGGKSWFHGLPRIVTPMPIRYVLPIDESKGVIMISYTDSKFSRAFSGKDPETEVMKEIRALFPEKDIPDPLLFKVHEWEEGVSYWLPGSYDVKEESERALVPFPKVYPGLFVCGESFSERQGWVEGALEHAALLLKKKFNLKEE